MKTKKDVICGVEVMNVSACRLATLPHFRHASAEKMFYRIWLSCGGAVEVWGSPGCAGYEFVVRDDLGMITHHSDVGYGSSDVCLRDGLIVSTH